MTVRTVAGRGPKSPLAETTHPSLDDHDAERQADHSPAERVSTGQGVTVAPPSGPKLPRHTSTDLSWSRGRCCASRRARARGCELNTSREGSTQGTEASWCEPFTGFQKGLDDRDLQLNLSKCENIPALPVPEVRTVHHDTSIAVGLR